MVFDYWNSRARLNADGHDESQYLPKILNPVSGKWEEPPPVNAYRAAKGDIRRNDDDKIESATWLPRIMFLGRRIEKEHYDMAVVVECVWLSAKKTLGILDLRGKLFDKVPELGTNVDVDAFLEMHRTMARPELEAVLWFVSFYIRASSAALPLERLGVILHGLENAQNIIDNCKRKRKVASYT